MQFALPFLRILDPLLLPAPTPHPSLMRHPCAPVCTRQAAARRGFALPAVDAALAAGGKPALASIPAARHGSAIAWLEGEGKLYLAQAANAATTDTTTTHQLGD